MAFNGYLIRIGNTSFPLELIKAETYKITPNQRMEVRASRDATGVLHRNTVAHTASKIEFECVNMTNVKLAEVIQLLKNNYTNEAERKLTIEYYDTESDSYKNAEVYVPDISYQIYNIDLETNTINYDPIRIAFIEY